MVLLATKSTAVQQTNHLEIAASGMAEVAVMAVAAAATAGVAEVAATAVAVAVTVTAAEVAVTMMAAKIQ